MEKKEDRRVTMTRRMLKEALTEMLRETDIYHVSIRELCQRADINRTTFYKYYGSQFDLLADMESHLEFARLIINNNVDPLFPQKIFSLEVLRETILERNRQHEADREYLFNYLIYGAYRVISLWLNKEHRESPEQIALLLMRFTQLE